MDELIADFIAETSENLQNLDNELVELEGNPDNTDLLSKIFRIMHTIKGTCGFFGFEKLVSVAHAAENILDRLRNKKLKVNSELISIILESIDTIRKIINFIVSHGQEPDQEYNQLIAKINKIIDNQEVTLKTEDRESIPTASNFVTADENREAQIIQTVKVKIEVLDRLMQQVTELVLSRNQLYELDRIVRNNKFSSSLQNLNLIISSIQELIMQTRMQPISNAWVRMPRMVRELSAELEKKIKLVMIGQETELDKQVIEAIKDPLVHMIRNSADHGLEKESERIIAGKPAEGVITLKAYHSGGYVIIEVSDDGYGINIQKIKKKIVEKSLAAIDEVEALNDYQIMQYIFRPGFSTSESVTSISGRGVGMDVIKSSIDSIHGSVELKSTFGQGTTFTIKIPLTLGIVPVLIVEIEGQKFGISQSSVLEMVLINEDSRNLIEEINGNKVLRLRENLLPIVSLSKILGLISETCEKDFYIVICEAEAVVFGLVVDNIYNTEEIVLKPVSSAIKSIDVYSGITLLGNGEIVITLDLNGITKHVLYEHTEKVKSVIKEIEEEKITLNFLLVKYNKALKAIPLELINRVEEVDVSKIEKIGNKKVLQSNDSSIYIYNLDSNYKMPNKGKQLIIVINNTKNMIGLVVEKAIEIFSQDIKKDLNLDANKLSTIVWSGKTVDIVNVNNYFKKLDQTLEDSDVKVNSEYKVLLLEDDSSCFSKLLLLLKSEGFTVMAVKNYKKLQKLINEDQINFDLFVIDLDISRDISGYTKLSKEHYRIKNIPVIGLTSQVDFLERGEENFKFAKVVYKTNYSELIKEIYTILKRNK